MERSSSVIMGMGVSQGASVLEATLWAYELYMFNSRKSISGFIRPLQKGMPLLTRESYNTVWR